jgi:hypothetical protein
VSFAVGDYLFIVHEENFGFGPADDGYIMGGIQSRGDQDFDIFGDVFLKNVYVVCEFLTLEQTFGITAKRNFFMQSTRAKRLSELHNATDGP